MNGNRVGGWRIVLVAWLLLSGAGVACAQGDIGTELKLLPEQVKFMPGKVSLFAAYEIAVPGEADVAEPFGEGGPSKVKPRILVPVYLINDTEEEISLPHSNGDICVRQEVNEDGEWLRSERHPYYWYEDDGRFGSAELPAKHFYIGSALLHSSDDAAPRDVRYRIYRPGKEDQVMAMISNIGQGRVSAESILLAQYDRAAISVAGLPKLVDLVSGRVKVDSQEYQSPRSHAMYRLRDFSGEGKAIEAMGVLLEELASAEKNTEDQRAEIDYISALEIYIAIAQPENALQICRKMVDDGVVEKLGRAYSFFLRVAKDIKGLENERREFFEQILSQPEHPFFVDAASAWTVSELVSRAEMQARLKGWQSNDAVPAKIRWAMCSLEGRVYPNGVYYSRHDQDLKTKLFQISIENITSETIRFSYRHPLDILQVQFTTEEGEPLPHQEVVAQTIAQAKDEELTSVVLEKGEIYTITGLNPWPMVDWSMVSPMPAYADFIVTIPKFGEVGSGYISKAAIGYYFERDSESIAALLKQPLLSPDSTTSVIKRKALNPGEAPGAR